VAQYRKAHKNPFARFSENNHERNPYQSDRTTICTIFDPYLSQAARGFVGRIPRYKLFNYILYWLHTGCQWDEIPIEQQSSSEKKKSVTTLFMLSSRNGAMTAV
jgi:hypothetical protein